MVRTCENYLRKNLYQFDKVTLDTPLNDKFQQQRKRKRKKNNLPPIQEITTIKSNDRKICDYWNQIDVVSLDELRQEFSYQIDFSLLSITFLGVSGDRNLEHRVEVGRISRHKGVRKRGRRTS